MKNNDLSLFTVETWQLLDGTASVIFFLHFLSSFLFFVLALIKAFKLVLQYAPLVRHTPGWRYHPEVSTGLELVLFVVVKWQAPFIKEYIGTRAARATLWSLGSVGKFSKNLKILQFLP